MLNPGSNFTALLTVKQIFVLTIATNVLNHKRISQVSKNIQSGACAFTMDLYCRVTHLLAITAGKFSVPFSMLNSKQKVGCSAAL